MQQNFCTPIAFVNASTNSLFFNTTFFTLKENELVIDMRFDVLPLEALDADPALLRGPLETHGPQPAGYVSVDEAVSEVSIQSRLDVLLPPDVQQGPGLYVRPQEAPRRVGLHSCSGL
uniref:Uncharacterized protein n=1 Tax=Poecilia mexicana TaxID=48701 RepID=A0A3B3X0Y3_9TELE